MLSDRRTFGHGQPPYRFWSSAVLSGSTYIAVVALRVRELPRLTKPQRLGDRIAHDQQQPPVHAVACRTDGWRVIGPCRASATRGMDFGLCAVYVISTARYNPRSVVLPSR